MNDIKLLSIKDLLPISSVTYATGVSPLSIVIIGDNMDQANEVFINDLESPEFMILSANRILAQVPTSERSSLLRKVSVIATLPSIKRKSLLSFEVGTGFVTISGIEKLVQQFCKLLLQSPGSNKFNSNDGGGLLKLVGTTVSRSDSKSVQAAVVSAVSRTKDQLRAKQGSDRRITADERLLSATTTSVGFDALTTTLSARIEVSAVSGKLAVANLTL